MASNTSEASLPAAVSPLFRAVARAAVPASVGYDEGRWTRTEAIVAAALADRPPSVRRQIFLFLRVLDGLARLRFRKRLAALDPATTTRLLRGLARAPVLLLRRGVWGVRTLSFMGCYAAPDAREALGYDARLRGWRDRGTVQGSWPDRAGAAPPEAGTDTGSPDPSDA